MITFAFIAVCLIIFMLCVRFIVHHFFPGWGTNVSGVLTGVVLFLPDMLTQAQALPWADILPDGHAKAVTFAILAVMLILRAVPRKAGA